MKYNDILIVDCGSTKTKWQFMHVDGSLGKTIVGQGMNPYHMSQERLQEIIRDSFSSEDGECVGSIFFYGAGCRGEAGLRMKTVLRTIFQNVQHIEVESDLLGAARALCGSKSGLVCILGTGEGSCLYDGKKIVQQVPSLGYILGDEGSGAVLGKLLVSDVLKGMLPEPLCHAFYTEMNLDMDQVLENVYRKPEANRFLASLTPFLSRHREHPGIRFLLLNEFERFVSRNVLRYGQLDSSVSFVGGVAYMFSEEVTFVLSKHGIKVGKILRDPMDGLVEYHNTRALL